MGVSILGIGQSFFKSVTNKTSKKSPLGLYTGGVGRWFLAAAAFSAGSPFIGVATMFFGLSASCFGLRVQENNKSLSSLKDR